MNLSRFIVSYPQQNDPAFGDKMGRKLEFRELLGQPGTPAANTVPNSPNRQDPFFYNYQMLPARWCAPWTNNRIILLRWDPGVGKTRGALQSALTWMRYSSHKKAILLADSEIILRAIQEEVVKYNNYDVELEARTFKQGPKGHGKLIAKTNYIKKQGFEKSTITSFMNAMRKEGDNWMEIMRERYKDYIFIIDEVHNLRSVGKEKQRYNDVITLLDVMRDICPFILLTATPIVNTWKDIFSIIGMMYPASEREFIEQEVDQIPVYTDDPAQISAMANLLSRYAYGKVSDRRSGGVVPNKVPVPTPLTVRDGMPIRYTIQDGDNAQLINENLYPVFMSVYQTNITQTNEQSRNTRSLEGVPREMESLFSNPNSFYVRLREQYDFIPPVIEGEGVMEIQDLLYEEDGRIQPSIRSSITLPDGTTENVFQVVWDTTGPTPVPRKDIGLGKYSAKNAELIRMLRYDPNLQGKAGYIHTLWVEFGVRPLAAALVADGWIHYTGNEYLTSAGTAPRFAIIDNSSSENQINRIIETFNLPANRDGSILRAVVGSRKSGISISFTNARFFIELSPDFNKTTRIQAEGRVFRADSLLWLPREERNVYTASIIALPYGMEDVPDIQAGIISNENYEVQEVIQNPVTLEEEVVTYTWNPATVEARMYYLSEVKHALGERMMNILRNVSIESIVEDSMRRDPQDVDTHTHSLLYSAPERDMERASILRAIPEQWVYPIDPSDMYTMRATAELISSHTYALTRYGMPRPVNSFGNVVTAYNPSEGGSQAFSLIYDRNFFVVDEDRGYTPQTIRDAVAILAAAPTREFDFYRFISRTNIGDIKTLLLEVSLALPSDILSPEDVQRLTRFRSMILQLYENFWNTFGGGRLVHILWYGIKHNSHLSKLGINSNPELNTRILTYNPASETSNSRWRYMDSRERETVYLSQMARAIADKELAVIANAQRFGYYVHFSVYDGVLRLREIYMEDWRKSKSFDIALGEATGILADILSITTEDLLATYTNNIDRLREDIFNEARRLNILIIR